MVTTNYRTAMSLAVAIETMVTAKHNADCTGGICKSFENDPKHTRNVRHKRNKILNFMYDSFIQKFGTNDKQQK